MLEGVAAVLDAVGQPVRLADVQVHAAPPGHVLVRTGGGAGRRG